MDRAACVATRRANMFVLAVCRWLGLWV